MKKAVPYLVLIVLAIAVLVIKKCKYNSATSKNKTISSHRDTGDVNRDRGFDRHISYLQYSKQQKCRTACRHITKGEVQETMEKGKKNYRKSDIHNTR